MTLKRGMGFRRILNEECEVWKLFNLDPHA